MAASHFCLLGCHMVDSAYLWDLFF